MGPTQDPQCPWPSQVCGAGPGPTTTLKAGTAPLLLRSRKLRELICMPLRQQSSSTGSSTRDPPRHPSFCPSSHRPWEVTELALPSPALDLRQTPGQPSAHWLIAGLQAALHQERAHEHLTQLYMRHSRVTEPLSAQTPEGTLGHTVPLTPTHAKILWVQAHRGTWSAYA